MKNPLLWSSLLFFHLDSPTFVGWGGRKLKSLRSMVFKELPEILFVVLILMHSETLP